MRTILESTLMWVRTQGYSDRQLPLGIIGDTEQCPIARALTRTGKYAGRTVRVGESHARIFGGYDSPMPFDLPADVQVFIAEFDDGLYPDLIEHA